MTSGSLAHPWHREGAEVRVRCGVIAFRKALGRGELSGGTSHEGSHARRRKCPWARGAIPSDSPARVPQDAVGGHEAVLGGGLLRPGRVSDMADDPEPGHLSELLHHIPISNVPMVRKDAPRGLSGHSPAGRGLLLNESVVEVGVAGVKSGQLDGVANANHC
jgi:hypothetical protein